MHAGSLNTQPLSCTVRTHSAIMHGRNPLLTHTLSPLPFPFPHPSPPPSRRALASSVSPCSTPPHSPLWRITLSPLNFSVRSPLHLHLLPLFLFHFCYFPPQSDRKRNGENLKRSSGRPHPSCWRSQVSL